MSQPPPAQASSQPARRGGAAGSSAGAGSWGSGASSTPGDGRAKQVPEREAEGGQQGQDRPGRRRSPRLRGPCCAGRGSPRSPAGSLCRRYGPPKLPGPWPSQNARGDSVIDAPGPDPVFPAVAERLARLGEDLAVEPAGRQPHGDQGRDDDHDRRARPSASVRAEPAAPLRQARTASADGQPDVGAPALGQEQADQQRQRGDGRQGQRAEPRPRRLRGSAGSPSPAPGRATSGPTRNPASELARAKVDHRLVRAEQRASRTGPAPAVPGAIPISSSDRLRDCARKLGLHQRELDDDLVEPVDRDGHRRRDQGAGEHGRLAAGPRQVPDQEVGEADARPTPRPG